jgi:hypothetical protein
MVKSAEEVNRKLSKNILNSVPVEPQAEEQAVLEIKNNDIKLEVISQDKAAVEVKQSPEVLNDSRVVRALLTRAISNKEPLDNISSFITVNKTKAAGVFYFTELVGMKGQIVSHQWSWNDKPVYEKKFKIFGDRWRIATSKVIPYTIAGSWAVRMIDEKGNSLNEIQFEVIKE